MRPSIDGGRFDVKRTVGEPVEVSAEVFRDGHDVIRAVVRYLPPGVKVGSKQASYLIVATYPFHDPVEALEKLTDGDLLEVPGGGSAMVDQSHPESVYLAFPGTDEQIEIFDPSPQRALAVAQSGAVRPVTP